MKQIYLAMIMALLSAWEVLAQENSVNEGPGNWTVGSTWQDGSAPLTSNISIDIIINGLVTSPTLDFKPNNGDLTISDGDTLVVNGNLTMNNGNAIGVGNSAVLVVLGDLSANNNLNVFSTGVILVTGQTTVGNGTNIFNGGGLYLLGGDNLTNDDFGSGSVDDIGDADDLNNDEPDLVTFLDTTYGTTLPVELLYFEAVAAEGRIILNWKTATETNNDYFVVERAAADRQFAEVTRVPGQGTVSFPVAYQIEDNNPPSGQLYYRLKQVDFDGTQHYHPATGVQFSGSPQVLVFPNPSPDGQFRCRTSEVIERAEYVDMAGILHRGQVVNANGVATISPVNALKKGHYVVRLLTRQRIQLANILIQ